MKAELRSCRSTLGVLRLRARYEVSNINGSPRSQNVRYQCANVGFLALKLPSHSDIIQARIVCRRPTTIRRQFLAAFLRWVPYRRHPLTRCLRISIPVLPPSLSLLRLPVFRPSSHFNQSRTWEPFSSSHCRDVINYDDDDGDDVLSSRTSAGK